MMGMVDYFVLSFGCGIGVLVFYIVYVDILVGNLLVGEYNV